MWNDKMQGTLAGVMAGVLAVTVLAAAVWWLRRRQGRAAVAPAKTKATLDRDPITGLLTPTRFELALQAGLLAGEKSGRDSCVIYAGLDGFRLAHDNFDAAFCDRLLAVVGERLRTLCGSSTPVCRVTADEFAIWLDAPREAGEKLASRLTEAFAEPLSLDGRTIALGLSAGLALAPEHGTNVRLVGKAAAAMHAVQRSGGAGHAVFDPRIEAEHGEESAIARELQHAVVKRQLELFYQPKIDAATLRVTAVEALLRWRHPTLGLVSPTRFIPIAERYGLIDSIGNWVLDAALKQAASWRGAGLRLRVAVNVSGAQFRQDDFAAKLERGLKAHGLAADSLSCEIAEPVAMENTEATRKAFMKLQKLRVHLSIEDFRAGAAGLAALPQLPAQELKIDRAAIAAMAQSGDARAIVENTLKAAHALGLRVVAEGIETEAQRELAVRLGCDELQGFLFAKPMSARAVALWAVDAPANLAQTFNLSSFKDTQPFDAQHKPTAFAATRISLLR
jgi:diguanylate cyclase (GGDEF)-like protein